MNLFNYFFIKKQVDGELEKGELGLTALTRLLSKCL